MPTPIAQVRHSKPAVADVIRDAERFLLFLASNSVTRANGHLLSKLSLRSLCSVFGWQLEPEQVRVVGQSERALPRLAYVHFLCEAAGLIMHAGRLIKPSPSADRWLRTTTIARARALWPAALEHAESARLWRAFRLPGWKLLDPDASLRAIAEIAQDTSQTRRARLTAISRLALPAYLSDDPDMQPRNLAEAVMLLAEWFVPGPALATPRKGNPTWLPTVLRMQYEGQHHRNAAAELHLATDEASALMGLCDFAALTQAYPVMHFTLDQATVQHALRSGIPATHIVNTLATLTVDALPAEAARAIGRWARALDDVTVTPAILLQTRSHELMADLITRRGVRACLAQTLSPRAAIVREDQATALVRRLQRAGLAIDDGHSDQRPPAIYGPLLDPGPFARSQLCLDLALHLVRQAIGERQHISQHVAKVCRQG